MKTLAEFIQRLQDDAAFEKQAQSFDHGDDLIAFVRREGYDFTLEQLMRKFEPGQKPPAEVSPPPPLRPAEANFPRQPEGFSGPARGAGLLKSRDENLTGGTAAERGPQPQAAMSPPGLREERRTGVFKGGGGRHRGFCPQRLKSLSGEDP